MNPRNVLRSREGFSLIEVMFAITITLVVVMSLAAGTATVARMSGASAGLVRRSAAMDQVAVAVATIPWADLPSGTECEDVTGDFPYERCITATDVSAREKQFTVVITPDDPRIAPDTITLDRGRAAGQNPFN